jgi:general secretion pathway protein G
MKATGSHATPRSVDSGFTLLELMLGLALASVLTVIAAATYTAAVERSRVAAARADIVELSVIIERHRSTHGTYPASLADVEATPRLDPWDRPYHYTLLEGVNGNGDARKDRRLNPLNSDFDLFSAGENGVYKAQISQKDSLDDVIRARMGAYVGLAEDF